MSDCSVCGLKFDVKDVVINELIQCVDCGTDFEVVKTNPLTVKDAPMEEEDWGQ